MSGSGRPQVSRLGGAGSSSDAHSTGQQHSCEPKLLIEKVLPQLDPDDIIAAQARTMLRSHPNTHPRRLGVFLALHIHEGAIEGKYPQRMSTLPSLPDVSDRSERLPP